MSSVNSNIFGVMVRRGDQRKQSVFFLLTRWSLLHRRRARHARGARDEQRGSRPGLGRRRAAAWWLATWLWSTAVPCLLRCGAVQLSSSHALISTWTFDASSSAETRTGLCFARLYPGQQLAPSVAVRPDLAPAPPGILVVRRCKLAARTYSGCGSQAVSTGHSP